TDTFELEGASFSSSHAINLATGRITFAGANRDILIGFENATADGNAAELIGSSGSNVLTAIGNFANSISGASGNDTIYAGDGNDTINDGAGSDSVYAGNGNDMLIVGDSSFTGDHFDGGGGTGDTISYQNFNWGTPSSPVVIDLNTNLASFNGFTETVVNIENVIGSNGDETINGANAEVNTLSGLGGNDVLNGYGGTDTIYGGDGDDRVIVLDGHFFDHVDGGNGIDTLDHSAVTRSGDTFDFELGIITSTFDVGTPTLANIEVYLDGSGGNTIVSDGTGDTYYGGGGNDYMIAEIGAETMYGGAGVDTIDLSRWNGAYVVDMTTGSSNYGGELYAQFENLNSGNGNDDITGTAAANRIFTSGGDDVIYGGGGADSINAGLGNDTLFGGAANDRLYGGTGNDTLLGEAGNDRLYGGGNNDTLTDGTGADTLTGGGGADIFDLIVDTSLDRVLDYLDGTDLIRLAGQAFGGLTFTDLGGGVVDIGYAGDTVRVEDTAGVLVAANFTAADFLFV
ncbi:MAG TPA: calcium-binding protein, partial [Paracoccaceae bacterium]|nr:calcium-binding protein [Paracoccaceae bacterium]